MPIKDPVKLREYSKLWQQKKRAALQSHGLTTKGKPRRRGNVGRYRILVHLDRIALLDPEVAEGRVIEGDRELILHEY